MGITGVSPVERSGGAQDKLLASAPNRFKPGVLQRTTGEMPIVLDRFESELEIVNEIAQILHADRQPDE